MQKKMNCWETLLAPLSPNYIVHIPVQCKTIIKKKEEKKRKKSERSFFAKRDKNDQDVFHEELRLVNFEIGPVTQLSHKLLITLKS